MAAKKNSFPREEVTEAAVMQTISENRAIRAYFKKHPTDGPGGSGVSLREIRASKEYRNEVARLEKQAKGGSSKAQEQLDDVRADTQILDSYLEQHADAQPVVLDYQHDSEKQWGTSALIGTDDGYTVAFSGTDQGEGIDNGEGMYLQSTFNQRMAAKYYDECYEAYGDFEDKRVTVVGHSKGGNKAMYTTMSASHADSIDSCVALDGQGFSQEFLNSWDGNQEVFDRRRGKIKLVAGKNDYVHALGYPIAYEENTFYLDYNGPVSIAKYHKHQYLFAHEGGGQSVPWYSNLTTIATAPFKDDSDAWTATLEAESSPGDIPKKVQDFMQVYMTYPADIKMKTAPGLMEFLWGNLSSDGVNPDAFMTLLYTFMASVALVAAGKDTVASGLFEQLGLLNSVYGQVTYDKASKEAAGHPEFYLDPVALAEGSSFSGNARVCLSLADIIKDLESSINRMTIPDEPLSTLAISMRDACDPAELAEIYRLNKEIAATEARIKELKGNAKEVVWPLEQVQDVLRAAIDYMANTAVMFEACESKACSLAEGWRSNPFGV